MVPSFVQKAFGREAFGIDPNRYHTSRPAYPDWVFEVLRDRCGLHPSTATFEIGPGTGIATRPLLAFGACPLVAVEPDHRLADFLCTSLPHEALTVIRSSFEDATLPAAGSILGFVPPLFTGSTKHPPCQRSPRF
jgi:hypothetical protein